MINFKFLNIPVIIHPTFWVFLLYRLAFNHKFTQEDIIYTLVFGFTLLIHELGHGLAAQYFKKNPEIHIRAFGGYTKHSSVGITDKQELYIILSGPLFDALLILFSYLLFKNQIFQNYYINYFFYVTYKINIFWLFINLIPLYPLDGGKLIRNVLTGKFKNKGFKHSVIISNICNISCLIYFFYNGHYFLGSFFIIYGFQNFQTYFQSHFSHFFHKKHNFSLYNESLKAIENNEMKRAKKIIQKLLKSNVNNNHKIFAIESLADILYKKNNHLEAYNLLLSSDHAQLKKGKCLLCKLAYEEKNYPLIEKYSSEIYEIDPTYEIAVLNSKTFAHLDNPIYSALWLKTASLFDNVKKSQLNAILEDKIYEEIKKNKAFKEHLKELNL